jgi:hypothetical protein
MTQACAQCGASCQVETHHAVINRKLDFLVHVHVKMYTLVYAYANVCVCVHCTQKVHATKCTHVVGTHACINVQLCIDMVFVSCYVYFTVCALY